MKCDRNGMKLFYLSAKVSCSVLIVPRLANPEKDIWFAKVKEKYLTSARFEPTTISIIKDIPSKTVMKVTQLVSTSDIQLFQLTLLEIRRDKNAT